MPDFRPEGLRYDFDFSDNEDRKMRGGRKGYLNEECSDEFDENKSDNNNGLNENKINDEYVKNVQVHHEEGEPEKIFYFRFKSRFKLSAYYKCVKKDCNGRAVGLIHAELLKGKVHLSIKELKVKTISSINY